MAGNPVKPLLSLYGTEWRERGYGLCAAPVRVCSTQSVLLLYVSVVLQPVLPLDVSAKQQPMLHLEVSSNLCCVWTCLFYRGCTTRTGYLKCREVKTGFYRNKSMQTGSSGTLIGWKSGQTTFVPLWDRMEGAWLRTQHSMCCF